MEDIYRKLMKSSCVNKEDYLQVQSRMEVVNEMRTSFLQELDRKDEARTAKLTELHIKEVKLITEIKQLIKTGEFKRAYHLNDNEDTRTYLEKLEHNQIECTNGLEELKKIKQQIEVQIKKQTQADKIQLKRIKKQVGLNIWEDLQHHFQSQEFLSFITTKNEAK